MATIVLVHGIAQEQKSADTLEGNGCLILLAECGRHASRRSLTACIALGPDPTGSTRGWRSTGTCFSGVTSRV